MNVGDILIIETPAEHNYCVYSTENNIIWSKSFLQIKSVKKLFALCYD